MAVPGYARLGRGAAVRCVLGFSMSLNSTESGSGSLSETGLCALQACAYNLLGGQQAAEGQRLLRAQQLP